MRVSYSPRAVVQIGSGLRSYRRRQSRGRKRIPASRRSDGGTVGRTPVIGRMTQRAGVHVIGLLPYRYLLFYKIINHRDEIRIIRVRHMRRKDAHDIRGL